MTPSAFAALEAPAPGPLAAAISACEPGAVSPARSGRARARPGTAVPSRPTGRQVAGHVRRALGADARAPQAESEGARAPLP